MYQIHHVKIQWRRDEVIDLTINCPRDHDAKKYTMFSNKANPIHAKILKMITSLLKCVACVASDCELAVFKTSSHAAFRITRPSVALVKNNSIAPVMIASTVIVLMKKTPSHCLFAANVIAIIPHVRAINAL